jgi:hypothetical protein
MSPPSNRPELLGPSSVHAPPRPMKATLMPYQTNSRPARCFWDMDGTLVDTEPHWMAAQRRLARDHDVEWTDAHATQWARG